MNNGTLPQNTGRSIPELEYMSFMGNSASGSAYRIDVGTMYKEGDDGSSSPTLTNVTFMANSADDD